VPGFTRLPNAAAPLIVVSTLSMAGAILSAAILSFLGLGARPPMPEWAPWPRRAAGSSRRARTWRRFPSLAIFVVVLAFNLLGDGLRDALDPQLGE
jgi:peptide/nickel transport system permease protein